ncbi:MAG: leucine-rich repeat protein, partial [Burkholderiaceae bacterium]|nr:leucine-rich repeat protein [Burkholderiaceae bacterium]
LVFSPVHAAVPANGDYVCSTGLIKTTETTNLYTITAGVVSWHSGGFCSGAVIIPAGVTGILEEAFEDDALLTSISIPASVSIIGSYAFSGTTNIRELEGRLPASQFMLTTPITARLMACCSTRPSQR